MLDGWVRVQADARAIAAFTDEVWDGWHPIIPPLPYRIPASARAAPLTEERLRSELLDGQETEGVVLSASPHPADAVTQLEYHAAYTRAANDWLVSTWLSSDPRVFGAVQVMPQLPDEAVAEIERWGAHPRILGITLPARGGEGYGLARYRPVFEAAARHDLVVALEVSASTQTAVGYPESLAAWFAGTCQSVMGQVSSLVFSGIFEELPTLRVLLLGGGWTWVPYLMWTIDSNYRPLRAEVPWLKRLPSTSFPDHIFFGASPFPVGAPGGDLVDMVRMAGHEGWLVWASGFPDHGHAHPRDLVRAGFPDDLRTRILVENPRRLYGRRLERLGAE